MRDFAEVRGTGKIDVSVAQEALNMLEVDELGLDRTDRTMLRAMMEKFGGGPVGLETLAATINEVLDGATPTIAWTPSLSAL